MERKLSRGDLVRYVWVKWPKLRWSGEFAADHGDVGIVTSCPLMRTADGPVSVRFFSTGMEVKFAGMFSNAAERMLEKIDE